MFNAYGPTETTVCASFQELKAETNGNPPIGRPIANARIYLLDRHGEPAGRGSGEIYIGGIQVARGYLNRPELTAERFVADPFAGEANARMYKSGDVGRYLADGAIEYLGRNDFQVKIRGFRVELGEIEARLTRHSAVHGSGGGGARREVPATNNWWRITRRRRGRGDCWKRRKPWPASCASICRRRCRAMTPAAYVRLEALPLTPNGKLDRNALPAPKGAYTARRYEAPVGEIKTALAEIWADALKLERVGRHGDFFDLGGHSLLAVRVASRVRQMLGVEVNVTQFFDHPALTEFARTVKDAARSELPPITKTSRDEPLALSLRSSGCGSRRRWKGQPGLPHSPWVAAHWPSGPRCVASRAQSAGGPPRSLAHHVHPG